MSIRWHLSVGIVVATLFAAPAFAQSDEDVQPNPAAPPTYGDVALAAGFTPDPYEVRIQAGGPIDGADALDPACAGFIAAAPDINFEYQAAGRPLYLYMDADADTTLIVNGPNDRWYCDDDSGNGLNAAVIILRPLTGTYHIWVGTYRAGAIHPASIMISELGVD